MQLPPSGPNELGEASLIRSMDVLITGLCYKGIGLPLRLDTYQDKTHHITDHARYFCLQGRG